MAMVKDPATGRRRKAETDQEKLAAQAAAALKDELPKGQASLEFCATCAHSRVEQHPNGPCIAEWEVDGGRGKRRCQCPEYWPERKQREEGFAVTDWTMRFSGSFSILHKRRVETELWESLKSGRTVRLLVIARVGPRGFKPVVSEGVMVSVEEQRPLRVETVVIVDGETGELFE